MTATIYISVPPSQVIRWRWTSPPRNAENPCDYVLLPTEEFAVDSWKHDRSLFMFFYVLLTVHLGIILVNNQPDAQFFSLYVYFYSIYVVLGFPVSISKC
jgi:hypothetical protein